MANVKISSLSQINITDADNSYIMVVARDEKTGLFKNYRISISELRTIIGSIEGDIVAGLTEEEVKQIVNSAISEDNKNELTSTVVSQMIEKALENLTPSQSGLTEAEVNALINSAIAKDNEKELTQQQVINLIGKYSTGLNATQVNELISAAITSDNALEIKRTDVETMINTALENLPECEGGLSEEEVQGLIDASLENLPEGGLTEEEVQGLIDTSVTEVQEDVNKITTELEEQTLTGDDADEIFNEIFNK
jgi:uncharacterized protein YpuA (DUF1002 family)